MLCLLTTLVPPHPRAGTSPRDLGPFHRTLGTQVLDTLEHQDRTRGHRDHIMDLQDIMDHQDIMDLQDHIMDHQDHTLEDQQDHTLELHPLH